MGAHFQFLEKAKYFKMKLSILLVLSSAQALLKCKSPRKYYRVGKTAIVECSKAVQMCKIQCQFGVKEGHPTEIICNPANRKWNHKPRTQIFCNSEAQATEVAEVTKAPVVESTMTACGDVRNNYLLPKEMTTSCTKSKCELTCQNGQNAVPAIIKCKSRNKKWSPRPFQKVMCLGQVSTTPAPYTAAPVLQIDVINSNPSDLSNFNGFDNSDQNTITNCGDMKKKQIKLEFGVAFDCQPGGCTYSCQNPLAVVNIDEVKCVKKNKKKMELRPKKATIKCTQPSMGMIVG